MTAGDFQTAFNARWLTPEQVARNFVPVPQFERLTYLRSSALLGARGCGKTTLLKMLTRPAQRVWRRERTDRPPITLAFEAIYVPSDVRWSYELQRLENIPGLNSRLAELAQRVFVSMAIVRAVTETFAQIVLDETQDTEALCDSLNSMLGFSDAVPTLQDVAEAADAVSRTLRGLLNRGRIQEIESYLVSLSPQFTAHVLDLPIAACGLFDRYCGNPRINKWALLFDELEIGPSWLRSEVLESLRGTDPRVILKVTYAPLLPSGMRTVPQAAEDFEVVRLWNSTVEDARGFCDELAQIFLAGKFGEPLSPRVFFRYSALAADDGLDHDDRRYDRGSLIYKEMKELAEEDPSFRAVLEDQEIDPSDPYTEDIGLRDTFFRKVRPVVILRRAFRNASGIRSRKVSTVYAGRQAIYAMSEGNPRWLLGLLNDLYDAWRQTTNDRQRIDEEGRPRVAYAVQARVLLNNAVRFWRVVQAVASPDVRAGSVQLHGVSDLVDAIGQNLKQGLLNDDFPLDPAASIIVDGQLAVAVGDLIQKALEVGAVVYIGDSPHDVPSAIAGSRFRITFMLAPLYRLPFRNYRAVQLQRLLAMPIRNPSQFELFASSETGLPTQEGER